MNSTPNNSPERGHICHLSSELGIREQIQFEDLKLAEGEDGWRQARQGHQLQSGPALCVHSGHGAQLLRSPASLQVLLQQPRLTDRRQKDRQTPGQQRVVLVCHV